MKTPGDSRVQWQGRQYTQSVAQVPSSTFASAAGGDVAGGLQVTFGPRRSPSSCPSLFPYLATYNVYLACVCLLRPHVLLLFPRFDRRIRERRAFIT